MRQDLAKYRVEVVSVMITNIHLPEALMKTTQQKNLAEQEKSMYDAKKDAEQRRIEFERTKAEADAQVKIITAEAGIKVAQHEARQVEERAKGEASKVRMIAEAEATKTKQVGDAEASIVQAKGEAQAKAYRDQVDALTAHGVTTVEVIKAISAAGLKITPDILVGAGGDGGDSGGLVQVLLAQLVRQQRIDVPPPCCHLQLPEGLRRWGLEAAAADGGPLARRMGMHLEGAARGVTSGRPNNWRSNSG